MSELETYKEAVKEIALRNSDFYNDTKVIATAVYLILEQMTDRKIEPSDSEKPNNCETCKYESLASYEGACDDCTDISGSPSNYEPKTEPLDKDTNVRSKESQTKHIGLDTFD